MSQKLLIATVGLPRSGKTTLCQQVSKDHGIPIVNPDSIRLAIHGQRFVAQAEPFVWATAKAMVAALFLACHDVVLVDATNLTRKRRDEWKSKEWKTVFAMLHATIVQCRQRANDAGDEEILPVIDRMADESESLGSDECEVNLLGANGLFPDGVYAPSKDIDADEGELRMAIVADKKNKIVRIEFGKPVAWLGLPVAEASMLAGKLMDKAKEISQ